MKIEMEYVDDVLNISTSDDIKYVIFRDDKILSITKTDYRKYLLSNMLASSQIFSSIGESKRAIANKAISVNGEKVLEDRLIWWFVENGDLILDTETNIPYEVNNE